MTQFLAMPDDVAAVFGPVASKFLDFLAASFSSQKEDVIRMSADRFESKLIQGTSAIQLEIAGLRTETRSEMAEVRTEIAGLRSEARTEIAQLRSEIAELRSETRTEIAELRTEIAELRSETRTEIAELRAELQTSIAGLRAEMKADFAIVQRDIAGLHGQIAGLHREISMQTKWMLAGLAAAVTLYPIITKLVTRLLP